MRILGKLLDNLGDVWNKLPKEVPFVTVGRGTGQHTHLTVDEGSLHFHTFTFRSELPQKQTIALKGMTTADLLATITSMGYTAVLTSEAQAMGVDQNAPIVLVEVENVELTSTLVAFTSNLWRTMYPIYRVLRQAEFDTEQALRQLYRPLATGEWLDFWASFFDLTREPNETDNNFVRRFTMWLFNPKTNNVALKELLSYRLQDTNIEIQDETPLTFSLLIGTKYLADAGDLHKILRESKGAGIEYFLNYLAPIYNEDYRLWLSDQTGQAFETLDKPTTTPTKTVAESFPAPSEVRSGSHTSTRTETFPVTSEVRMDTVMKTLTDMFVAPSEVQTKVLTSMPSDVFFQNADTYLEFDGITGYVKVANPLTPSLVTIEAFVKSYNVNQDQTVVGRNPPIFIRISAGRLRVGVYANGTWVFANGAIPLQNGKWHHLCMTYDGANMKGYVDGVLDIIAVQTGNIATTSANLYFGFTRDAGENYPFNGVMSRVSMWNYARTASEVVQGIPTRTGTEPGLVGHWELGNVVAGTVTDSTPNAKHGTVYEAFLGQNIGANLARVLSVPSEDTYVIPQSSNVEEAFETNSDYGETNDDTIFDSSLAQDVLHATITVGGATVEQRYL